MTEIPDLEGNADWLSRREVDALLGAARVQELLDTGQLDSWSWHGTEQRCFERSAVEALSTTPAAPQPSPNMTKET